MNKLSVARRAEVVRCLDEGNSIRATVRPTGVAKNTISKLLLELGAACARFQNETLVNLTTKGVEADETWSFIGMKEKQVPLERRTELGVGDVWTWTAIDADSKLCLSRMVGERDTMTAVEFMADVASRPRTACISPRTATIRTSWRATLRSPTTRTAAPPSTTRSS